jgi:hypothetical protein
LIYSLISVKEAENLTKGWGLGDFH